MNHHTRIQLPPEAVLVAAPEFVLIPVEEGYILDGGRQPEMLSGPMTLSSLPVILPRIDGTRSLGQLVDAFPTDAKSGVEEAIQQLLSWGVLCLREELSARAPQMRNTLSSLKRSDSGASLDAASSLLAITKVSIVCDELSGEFAHKTAEALKQNGFCHVHAHVHPGSASAASSEDSFVISLVNEESSSSILKDHYAQVLSTGCRWLRASLGTDSAEIGPVFTSDTNLCLHCLSGERSGEGLTSSGLCRMDQVAWPAILASEATSLLLSPNHASRAFRSYRLPFFASEVRTWPTTGLCICDHGGNAGRQSSGKALLVEQSRNTGHLPLLYEEALASRQEISDASVDSAASLTSAKKMLSGASTALPTIKVDLPQRVLSLLVSTQKERARPLTLETVTQLLALSVGIKAAAGSTMRRWAPSGGNLGSTEAYLVAIDVKGLAPGVYFYKPEEHALKKLNQRNMNHVAAACAAVHSGPSAAAMVVLSGAYSRIARKYGPFAYKLSHLDTGAASSQFLLTASALEVRVRGAQSWDSEALRRALVLRTQEEISIQVFCLNSQKATAIKQGNSAGFTPEGSPLQDQITTGSVEPSPEQLTEQFGSLSRFVQDRLPARMAPNKPFSIKHFRNTAFAGARSQVTLGGALNQRSSQRAFLARGIDLLDINLLLRSALDNNVFAESRLSVSVLVQRSDSCGPGIYQVEPGTMSLSKKREAFTQEQIEDLFLIKDYSDTPLIVWISGRIDPAAQKDQNHGEYQTLLLRAGLLGHRLWMAALGLGLEGTLIAGIRSGAASRSEQFIEVEEISLLAFICGYAPQEKVTEVRKI